MELNNLANLAALLTALGSLIIAYTSRRKIESEAQSAATIAYMSLVAPLRDRVSRLETELGEERKLRLELEGRVEALSRENHKLMVGVKVLIQQISDLGTIPNWRPEDE